MSPNTGRANSREMTINSSASDRQTGDAPHEMWNDAQLMDAKWSLRAPRISGGQKARTRALNLNMHLAEKAIWNERLFFRLVCRKK